MSPDVVPNGGCVECEVCQKEIGEIIVPLPLRAENGNLETLACLGCAEKSEVYCTKHQRSHVRYSDDTTSCLLCAMELAEINKPRAELLISMMKDAAPMDFELLCDERIPAHYSEQKRTLGILIIISAAALGRKLELDELLRQIVVDESLNVMKVYKVS